MAIDSGGRPGPDHECCRQSPDAEQHALRSGPVLGPRLTTLGVRHDDDVSMGQWIGPVIAALIAAGASVALTREGTDARLLRRAGEALDLAVKVQVIGFEWRDE